MEQEEEIKEEYSFSTTRALDNTTIDYSND
jgi:hypothetical protein